MIPFWGSVQKYMMIAFFGNTYFDSEGHNTKTLKPCPVVSSENEMTVRKGSPAQKS